MRYSMPAVSRKRQTKSSTSSASGRSAQRLKPRQLALMRMQQQQGNKFAQRQIARLQREEEAKKGGTATTKEGQGEKKGFDLGDFISEQVYDAIKENLSDAKLKGYATTVAKSAADEIIKLIGEGVTDPTALDKAASTLSSKLLRSQLDTMLKDIFAGPTGQKLRSKLLSMSQDPHQAVGLALLGLAAMIATNAEIPQLKKSYKIGGGLSADGSATLGKFQEIAIKNVSLGLKYSSKHFNSSVSGGYTEKGGANAGASMQANAGPVKAGVSGSYKSEGDDAGASGKANIIAASDEAKAELAGKLTSSGDFNVNLGTALDLDKFALSGSGAFDSIKGWSGVGELRIGPKESHLSVKQSFNPASESTLSFGPKLNTDVVTAMAMLNMSAGDQTLDTSIALKNPFGIKDFSMKAYMLSDLDDGVIKKAGLDGNWTLHQKLGEKGETQSLILLTFDAKFVSSQEAKPAGGQGAILLQGFW